jgi:hypothetical protein
VKGLDPPNSCGVRNLAGCPCGQVGASSRNAGIGLGKGRLNKQQVGSAHEIDDRPAIFEFGADVGVNLSPCISDSTVVLRPAFQSKS